MSKVTQEFVRSVIEYNKETGSVVWLDTERNRKLNALKCLHKAGSLSPDSGYTCISFDSTRYQMHRVIWLYVTGSWPKGQIDHINGRRSDNRWCNLRDVTHQNNGKNTKLRSNNKSGLMGVCWAARELRWGSFITDDKKPKHIGFFVDFFEACCARKSAEIKYGFHENHGRLN